MVFFIGYLHEKRKQYGFQKSTSVETKDVFVECMSLFRHHRLAKPRKYLGNHLKTTMETVYL